MPSGPHKVRDPGTIHGKVQLRSTCGANHRPGASAPVRRVRLPDVGVRGPRQVNHVVGSERSDIRMPLSRWRPRPPTVRQSALLLYTSAILLSPDEMCYAMAINVERGIAACSADTCGDRATDERRIVEPCRLPQSIDGRPCQIGLLFCRPRRAPGRLLSDRPTTQWSPSRAGSPGVRVWHCPQPKPCEAAPGHHRRTHRYSAAAPHAQLGARRPGRHARGQPACESSPESKRSRESRPQTT